MGWVLAGATLLVLGAGLVVLPARVLDRVVARAVAAVEDALGGSARVEVRDAPLAALLALRRREPPTARLEVADARLPNGLRVARGVLWSDPPDDAALVAEIDPGDVAAFLAVQGLQVEAHGDRLRCRLGPARLDVEVTASDGRVVLRVPTLLPPFRGLLSAGLTELVPPVPAPLVLEGVAVVDGRVVVRGTLPSAALAELATPDGAPGHPPDEEPR